MQYRQAVVAVLLCVAVAAVVGGLIAVLWHVIPEEYSLLMRWIAYGLICIGVQCGCLLVRCLCLRRADSWCPAVDNAVSPGAGTGPGARRGEPTTRMAAGAVLDPDDKPPAYSQVMCEESQLPPPFLDAVRRESLDEALQAETEAEFLREALEGQQTAARRAEIEARRAHSDARKAEQLLAEAQARQEELRQAEAEAEIRETEAEVEVLQSEASHTEAEIEDPPS